MVSGVITQKVGSYSTVVFAAEAACKEIPEHMPQIRYLQFAGYPIYNDTQIEYFSPGEEFFPVLLAELKKAEHYIFMEYFIIQEGVMWCKDI